MKYYIFITADIHPIGGMQNYVEGKAEYLEQNGWTVRVLFWGKDSGVCKIPSLNKYLSGGLLELGILPERWTKRIRKNVMDRMIQCISGNSEITSEDEVVIESHDEKFALWGELLANELHGKNMCFICNEKFRGPHKYYEDYLEFFDFKHKRRELTGIHEDSLCRLFGSYKEVAPNERYCFKAENKGPVQNVKSNIVDQLKKNDWNICYIGRADKLYVEKIIQGVARFASRHIDKMISFIMVGDAECRMMLLNECFEKLENVQVVLLGDLVPIPRSLYKKVDAVIAGSGCATCSAYEGVPVIVPDAGNSLANGVLGYTTFDPLFHGADTEQVDYDFALEQVLIEKIQNNFKFNLGPRANIEDVYKKHLEFVEQSDSFRQYYLQKNPRIKVDVERVLKYYIKKYSGFMK